MSNNSPIPLFMRLGKATPKWELAVRYAAAYASTVIAIAAAQLSIENEFVLPLLGITLIGLPISLLLRRSKLQVGRFRLRRPILNSLVVVLAIVMSVYALASALPDLLSPEFSRSFWLQYSAGQVVSLLMKVFLIFASCRCLVILNDKDAVLCAVPSFSVLLLMIPIHKGPEVVVYFFLWAVVCAILFALDHHSELRQGISGYLPSLVPGQEAATSARSLATVMCFSLICAGAISYTLSQRSPDERTGAEGWITSLASRFTRFALDLPDISVNAGPERQIDFSSGPALPTAAPLWQVRAINLTDGSDIRPSYWRMFTLSRYDGTIWSQSAGSGWEVPLEYLNVARWPRRPGFGGFGGFGAPGSAFQAPSSNQAPTNPSPNRAATDRPVPGTTNQATDSGRRVYPSPQNMRDPYRDRPRDPNIPPGFNSPPSGTDASSGGSGGSALGMAPGMGGYIPGMMGPGSRLRYPVAGYDLARSGPGVPGMNGTVMGSKILKSFGRRRRVVRQIVRAMVPNTGFLPTLPAVRAVRLPQSNPKWVRTRSDNSVDIGVLQPTQRAEALSEVAADQQFGLPPIRLPEKRTKNPNPAINLMPSERQMYLELPTTLPRRVRQWALRVANNGSAQDSDYVRARRLRVAVQNAATYTLRPPNVPAGHDATDFFLFESRRGYCTYFAGALAVTCRAAGIPARVVSGFTNPQWNNTDGYATFREANSHAWTEVWIPDWGWATLDATPPDDRGDNAPTWLDNWHDFSVAALEYTTWWFRQNPLRAVAFGITLIAAALFCIVRGQRRDLITRWLRGRMGRPNNIDDDLARRLIYGFYARAARGLSRRYRRRAHWETPFEWLSAAESSLDLNDTIPLRHLTSLYARAKYSPDPLGHDEVEAARLACSQLSWQKRRVE